MSDSESVVQVVVATVPVARTVPLAVTASGAGRAAAAPLPVPVAPGPAKYLNRAWALGSSTT